MRLDTVGRSSRQEGPYHDRLVRPREPRERRSFVPSIWSPADNPQDPFTCHYKSGNHGGYMSADHANKDSGPCHTPKWYHNMVYDRNTAKWDLGYHDDAGHNRV